MPRIRTVKPEFWDDEKLSRLSIASNLLYIGMWTHADDEGVISNKANWIKSKIFPHREELRLSEVKDWIGELEKSRMIVPFEYNGEGYYVIRNFKKHQRIDKPQPSKIPTEVIQQFQEQSKNVPRTLPPLDERRVMERMGERSARAPDQKFKTAEPYPATNSPPSQAECAEFFNGVGLSHLGEKFYLHYKSRGWRGIEDWLALAQKWALEEKQKANKVETLTIHRPK